MTVKYAGQLSAVDLGHAIRYVKKYRYGGEDREKVVVMPNVIRVWHSWDIKVNNAPVDVTVVWRKTKYTAMEYERLSPLQEVEVVDANE